MHLSVNDINMHIEVAGDGPPLLLLHGFTGAASNWGPFISSWSQRFKVIRVDLIGHGVTDAPTDTKRYSMMQAVCDMVSVLDKLSIEKASILGYSMGGRLALATAVRYPERINALLLESSSPGLRTEQERRDRVQRDEALANCIEQDGVGSFIDRWEKLPLFATQREQDRDILRHQRMKNNPTGLAGSLRGMGTGAQESLWGALLSLHLPVRLVAGALDDKFCGIAGEMDHALPNSQVITVPDAGHAVHVEKPRSFDKIVMKCFYKIVRG